MEELERVVREILAPEEKKMPEPGVCPVCLDCKSDFDTMPLPLAESARRGCKICHLIIGTIGFKLQAMEDMADVIVYGFVDSGCVKSIHIKDFIFELFVKSDIVSIPKLRKARSIAKDSKSEQCFSILKDWLRTCRNDHPLCGGTAETVLPTRILDVFPYELDPSQADIRLCELGAARGRYVALSYCWGNAKTMTLTSSNLQAYKGGLRLEDLPCTLQDAVVITRRLGIRYLWIDALCIVQDDSQDWERESIQMGRVYENAYLVIAATLSASSHAGIYGERPEREERRITTQFGEDSTPYEVYCRFENEHDSSFDFVPGHAERNNPLFTRAWTMQERLLARRVVHYTKHELIWECRSTLYCECGRLDGCNGWKSKQWSITSGDNTPESKVRLWYELVSAYSSRKLTVITDRLPAISALADQLQHYGAGSYVAGLWTYDLLKGLLWRRDRQVGTRPETWIGPSWSWISVKTNTSLTWAPRQDISKMEPLNIFESFVSADAEVLNIDTQPDGLNQLGSLSAAVLTIRARVTEATMTLSDILEEGSSTNALELDTYRIRRIVKGVLGDETVLFSLSKGDLRATIKPDVVEDWSSVDGSTNENVLCLQIGSLPIPGGVQALVLRKSRGICGRARMSDCYERIGMLSMANTRTADLDKWFDDAIQQVVKIV